jgi:hypothetical protein
MPKRPLLCSKSITLEIRKQYVKTFVWPAALYGSEAKTIGKTHQKRIEAFEAWCWRRMFKIKWTENVRKKRYTEELEKEVLCGAPYATKNKVILPRNKTKQLRGKYNGGKN